MQTGLSGNGLLCSMLSGAYRGDSKAHLGLAVDATCWLEMSLGLRAEHLLTVCWQVPKASVLRARESRVEEVSPLIV